MPKFYSHLKKVHDKNGELAFEAEIPGDILEERMAQELVRAASDITVPGFRKGKVPEHIARERLSEMDLLENATNKILRDAIREMISEEKLTVMGVPQITITKLAPKNPVSFTVRFALFPSITLPDYKKIGRVINERKDTAAEEPATAGTEAKTAHERELEIKDKKREEMIAEIIKASKVKIPDLLIEQELYGFTERRDEALKQAGLSLDAYVKQIGKTPEELEKQERTLIEDQIKMSLTFEEIRKKEGVTASENEIHQHIPYLKTRYPDRDESALHETARAFVIQEKLFAILEGETELQAEAKIK